MFEKLNDLNSIIGDLVNGEIDIAVAGMTMTSEREEVNYKSLRLSLNSFDEYFNFYKTIYLKPF